MSYRIAYVRFTKSGQTYPVNCNRSDLSPADLVVVEMNDRDPRLRIAEIDRIEFLNWCCKNTILCKRSEYRLGENGRYVIELDKGVKIYNIENLISELRKIGWRDFHNVSRVYSRVLIKRFEKSGAAIGIRRNGIDFQIFDDNWDGDLENGPERFPHGNINLVRHNFYASQKDLIELSREFALNAHRPFHEINKYFNALGGKPPRPKRECNDMHDIRELLGDAMTDTERDAFG